MMVSNLYGLQTTDRQYHSYHPEHPFTLLYSPTASARVLEKAGFQFEGILKSYYYKDEDFVDGRMYGLTKADYIRQSQ
jgi:hypothetical protein